MLATHAYKLLAPGHRRRNPRHWSHRQSPREWCRRAWL